MNANELHLFIGPFDVDFTEIAVEEVPDSGGTGLGYFGQLYGLDKPYNCQWSRPVA